MLAFLLTWFYGGVFETFWNGQTPGKRLMRIRVLSIDGQRDQRACRRCCATCCGRSTASQCRFYLLGLVAATMNDRFQRLGDLACGTMVVVEERQWYGDVVRVDDPAAIRLAAELPPGFLPSRSLARALATYVGRRKTSRRRPPSQIARHLGVPLWPHVRPAAGDRLPTGCFCACTTARSSPTGGDERAARPCSRSNRRAAIRLPWPLERSIHPCEAKRLREAVQAAPADPRRLTCRLRERSATESPPTRGCPSTDFGHVGMKVSDLVESRRENWRELERLCMMLEGRIRGRRSPETIARFAALYRAACADLALADAYQLPRGTVTYLHQLVGRAHNQLYRSRMFNVVDLGPAAAGRRAAAAVSRTTPCGWRSASSGACSCCRACWPTRGRSSPSGMIGKEMMTQMEEMYSEPIEGRTSGMDGRHVRVLHRSTIPGIGLRCFALGLVFGVGGLLTTIHNAALLGGVFGHMATTPQSDNFFHFVTAHGPYELTAIVLSAAAGMRLGFSLVDTHGLDADGLAAPRGGRGHAHHVRRDHHVPAGGDDRGVPLALGRPLLPSRPAWPSSRPATLVFYFVILGYPREEPSCNWITPESRSANARSSTSWTWRCGWSARRPGRWRRRWPWASCRCSS